MIEQSVLQGFPYFGWTDVLKYFFSADDSYYFGAGLFGVK
jgi:hypothetical protein